MIGRNQVKYNAPFLYLTKREEENIYDLFILIEVFKEAHVHFPEFNQLPQNVDHPEINIRILFQDHHTSSAIRQEYHRYTFDFSAESNSGIEQKKVIVRTLID